ncbi:MAG TPA: TldD/PmbA family protein [Candidatus Excrementavichristensenella intestinipullorum]|nr:TldD/PmbA family protein [Candidatus Excrementavichristensenella intestinipullorum]
MNTQAFIDQLLDLAHRAGFQAAEAYLTHGDAFEATVHQGQINTYDVSSRLGLGFRGLYQGRMGYASTQVLDEQAAGQLVEGAMTNARLMESGEEESLYPGGDSYPQVEGLNPALEQVSAGTKLAKVLALEKAALALDPRVDQLSDCGLFTSRGGRRMVNTLGLDVAHESNSCGMYLSAVARQGDKSSAATKFRLGMDFEALNVEELAREAVEEAVAGLEGGPIPSGSYPVALRNDVAAEILAAFTGAFSADAAQKGLSLLKGREGEMIAAPCLTLMDDPLLAGGLASTPFDGEGVAHFANAVIREGRLNTLLHNRKTARKQGCATTGNAARGSYSGSVQVGPTNFFFAPGPGDRQALLAQMDRGLLITQVQGLHSGANPVTGDFSLGARGFRVEKGKTAEPVSGITVAGNFFHMLKSTCLAAEDLYFGTSSIGSPTLWVGELKVAGT